MQTSPSLAIFSALLLSIIAAAGLVKGVDSAWIFAGITAAIAVLTEQLRVIIWRRGSSEYRDELLMASNVLALASWATAGIAAFALLA